jgi:hypothetical protein
MTRFGVARSQLVHFVSQAVGRFEDKCPSTTVVKRLWPRYAGLKHPLCGNENCRDLPTLVTKEWS